MHIMTFPPHSCIWLYMLPNASFLVQCSQLPLLTNLLIGLHLIADLKSFPILEPHAALSAFPHLCDVLFDVLEGSNEA